MRLMFPSQIAARKHPYSYSITLIYQKQTIFMISFLYYDVNEVKTFKVLNFDMILTIFIFQALCRTVNLVVRNA